ncbi:adenylyl-sulfate kinase [Ralstonia sp.]|uniref:adenylyl-sulfate kinase n=1 Tax=Ralstonia sp. TaxID=54061 RepID=UPI0031E3EE1D
MGKRMQLEHKRKAIVLIQGLPGSGKTTLAKMLLERLPTACWVNADYVRQHVNRDLTFTLEHRIEHARRMAAIAHLTLDHGANDHCIVDFVCPTVETRRAFVDAAEYPIYTVFMNTITPDESRFADTRNMYQAPTDYAFRVSGYKTKAELQEIAQVIHLALINRNFNVSDANLRRTL